MKKSQLVSIIAEQLKAALKEDVQTLKIAKYISDEGNSQIGLTIRGAGFSEDGEIILSMEEAKVLHELCKSFLRERRTFSKGVNTEDKNLTQSTIKIEANGLKCIISRQEGSIYKGYDEQSGSNTGYFVADQSIAYQIVDKLLSNVSEGGMNSKNEAEAPAVPTDVTNLAKAQGAATGVALRAKNIDNPQEFPGAFKAWFETLGYEPGDIGKGVVRASVDKVLTDLGYK